MHPIHGAHWCDQHQCAYTGFTTLYCPRCESATPPPAAAVSDRFPYQGTLTARRSSPPNSTLEFFDAYMQRPSRVQACEVRIPRSLVARHGVVPGCTLAFAAKYRSHMLRGALWQLLVVTDLKVL